MSQPASIRSPLLCGHPKIVRTWGGHGFWETLAGRCNLNNNHDGPHQFVNLFDYAITRMENQNGET